MDPSCDERIEEKGHLEEAGLIPKIIHYCWFGGSELPSEVLHCMENWRKYCPDYEIIRWDETNYDYKRRIYTRQAYEAKKWAFVSDVARLEAVYEYGGFYLDTDVELVRSLDCLRWREAFMGRESRQNVATGLGFGAVPNHPLIAENIKVYNDKKFVKADGSYDLRPCPEYTTEMLLAHGLEQKNIFQKIEGVCIFPTEYLCPELKKGGLADVTEHTISIHHGAGTWTTEKERKAARKRRWVYTYFGKTGRSMWDGFIILKEEGFKSFVLKLIQYLKRKMGKETQ